MDIYKNFKELSQNEKECDDYKITFKKVDSSAIIVVPHGGGIEPGTSEIGKAIASNRFSLYCFEGIKNSGNKKLHIKSTNFDESRALKLIKASTITLTIHGSGKAIKMTYVGGKNKTLRNQIIDELEKAGFKAKFPKNIRNYCGLDDNNICNRNKRSMGVQLEISNGLRKKLFYGLDKKGRRKTTELFKTYVNSIREVLINYVKKVRK